MFHVGVRVNRVFKRPHRFRRQFHGFAKGGPRRGAARGRARGSGVSRGLVNGVYTFTCAIREASRHGGRVIARVSPRFWVICTTLQVLCFSCRVVVYILRSSFLVVILRGRGARRLFMRRAFFLCVYGCGFSVIEGVRHTSVGVYFFGFHRGFLLRDLVSGVSVIRYFARYLVRLGRVFLLVERVVSSGRPYVGGGGYRRGGGGGAGGGDYRLSTRHVFPFFFYFLRLVCFSTL